MCVGVCVCGDYKHSESNDIERSAMRPIATI